MNKRDEAIEVYRAVAILNWQHFLAEALEDLLEAHEKYPGLQVLSVEMAFLRGGWVHFRYLTNLMLERRNDGYYSAGRRGTVAAKLFNAAQKVFPRPSKFKLTGYCERINGPPTEEQIEWAWGIATQYGVARDYASYEFTFEILLPARHDFTIEANSAEEAREQALEKAMATSYWDTVNAPKRQDIREVELKITR